MLYRSDTLALLLLTAIGFSGCGSIETPSDDANTSADTNTSVDTNSSSDTSVSAYTIVDTGQITCYDSISGYETACQDTGYDADYDGNVPGYTTDGSIVTDTVTDLMWIQSSDVDGDGNTTDIDDKLTYSEAIDYCSDLTLGGYNDWRLPDIKTLYSLILFTGEDPSGYSGDTSELVTFLDGSFTRAFGDEANGERVIDAQYATTTHYVFTVMNGQDAMFGVNFVDGRIKGYPVDGKSFYTLCVRGNTTYGQNSFEDNGDGTISDKASGLMWERDDTQSVDFDDAVTICKDAATAGYDDWRLPDAKELQSIVDYTRSPDTTNSAAIDPLFNATSIMNEAGQTDWGYYWSSTTHLNEAGGFSAAYVSFGRALGYMNDTFMDVHGAGAQRSNDKVTFNDPVLSSGIDADGDTFYYKGPQGDIFRRDNMVRYVREDL